MLRSTLEVGDVIDARYSVERILGHGGMGVVVAARRLGVGNLVALKFPLAHHAHRSDIAERLLREARAAMALRSEHSVRIFDVGLHKGIGPYLVMEYLLGHDLARAMDQEGRLSIETAIEHTLQACEALSEAHALGIVHRDIKPSNLFLTRRPDGSPLVKVIDFGLARNFDSARYIPLTGSGVPLGSPPFMAPEQMRNADGIDARADVFSLGATLYSLIAGSPPFPGKSIVEVHARVMAGVPPIREHRAEVHPDLEALLNRCLQSTAEARFANMADLAEALAPLAPLPARLHARRARGIVLEATRRQASPLEPAVPSGGQETAVTATSTPLVPPHDTDLPSSKAPSTAGALVIASQPSRRRRKSLSVLSLGLAAGTAVCIGWLVQVSSIFSPGLPLPTTTSSLQSGLSPSRQAEAASPAPALATTPRVGDAQPKQQPRTRELSPPRQQATSAASPVVRLTGTPPRPSASTIAPLRTPGVAPVDATVDPLANPN
jgi:eukaryotic-like serine/threonine-protein kinase